MQKLKLFFIIALTVLLLPVLFFSYGAGLVDINTASLTQLDRLVGIGPALGQKIIDNRPYTSVDDLLKIQGIGPKNLAKIKQQGIACVNCQILATSTSIETPTTTIQSDTKSDDRPTLYRVENVFISEVLPSPEGSDTENEFIEIFNANNFEVDASGFKIKDKIGATKTFSIPTGTKIPANNFLSFKSSQTKISLNNDADGLELLGPTGQIVDSTDYIKAKQGQSWSKIDNLWQWTAKPTPGQANVIVAIQAASTRTSSEPQPNSSAQATSSKTNNLAANIQNYPPQKKNFLAVGIAIVIALASALIAWRIKKSATEI